VRAFSGLLAAASILFPAASFGQGITTNPKPPSRPPATNRTDKKKRVAPPQRPPERKKQTPTDKPPEPTPEPTQEPPKEPKKLEPKVEVHGGAWLFWYQPFNVPGEVPFLRMHLAHLNFDGSLGDFGLFFSANVRDTKMREFYDGPAWIEEGYFYYKNPNVIVKLGKTYSRFGLLWENSFYGNVHFYDGIKLDPNYGLSAEGSVGAETGFRLGYYGQFFLVDGRTNGSFVGRDTISVPDARTNFSRRRNMFVARAEPSYVWNKDTSLTFGLSGQYFQADLPEPYGKKDVVRFAIDATLNAGPISAWVDLSRQNGQHVVAYPIEPLAATATSPAVPGRASAQNDYLLVGGETRIWKLSFRYNVSAAFYKQVGLTEWLHVPGVQYNVNDNLQVFAEYAYWHQHKQGGGGKLFDNTLAVTLHGYF